VFIIANSAWYEKEDELPFDLRHRRRPILYHLPAGSNAAAREAEGKQLARKLKDWIGKALERNEPAIEFQDAASRGDDPSVWFQPNEALKHRDFHDGGGPEQSITVFEGAPRAYIRVIPAGWRHGEPRRDALLKLPSHTQFFPPGTAATGDGGPNSHGLLRYWKARRIGEPQAISAAQIFRKTGEIWAFDGQVGDSDMGVEYLVCPRAIKGWSLFLMTALELLTHWEARGPIKVTVGVVGMTGLHWPPRIGRRVAYEDGIEHAATGRVWNEEAQRAFLVSAAAKLFDNFGLTAPTEQELGDLIRPAAV